MKNLFNTKSFRYGVEMFLAIGVYFLALYALDLADITELRYFNLVIVIYFLNSLARSNAKKAKRGYLENLTSLFVANLISTFLCIFGLLLFNAAIGTDFLDNVTEDMFVIKTTSVPQAIFLLFAEGVAGGAVVSFALMQYWKNDK